MTQFEDGCSDGAISADGNVIGTYLHGLFDDPAALGILLNWAGLKTRHTVDVDALREEQLERLADTLLEELDLSLLFPDVFLCSREAS